MDCAATSVRRPLRGLAALALAAALLTGSAIAADAADAEAAAAPAARAPAYRLAIDAPKSLASAIERSVGLARWQSYADMTDELLDRLAREARDEAAAAAAAEGYFSARIDITIDRSARPAKVTLTATPGEPTRIASVRVDLTDAAGADAQAAAAIARARSEWALPTGEIFRQSAWAAAKDRALATLHAGPFAAARIAKSEAAVDPEARTADLAVEIDSGPPFRFGGLRIEGLARYEPSLVRNYSTIRPGDRYDATTLEQFIRRLNSTGYFSSVQATIDPDAARADDATTRVRVIEAPTRNLEAGLSYSTDVRFGAKVNYRDVDVDRRATQMSINGELDSKIQGGALRFARSPNESGWIATYGVGAKRTDIEGLVTQTLVAGTRWHTVEERRERALSATFYVDDQHPDGAPSQRAHATYAEFEQYWRESDHLVAPTRGFMASAQAGGGVPGISTRGFGRVVGRLAAWIPLGSSAELDLRADAGAVLSGTRDGIPSTLLFRTGGDTTVRGYAFDSLGVRQGDAVVGGRYYAVGSVEAIRWFAESWGLAAFVDAGNAADSLSDFRFAVGYGGGLRVRTPLGPFRLDVAYGRQAHEVRTHFSVGLSF